ncbi:MAG: hypothetical protein KIT33_01345 [Candidatus Kapabacteria bacterium]|nr:hypothetical protein [Ignavibacteriota bacterium]MCW5883594.1 hypothetical protein [Candidatus Kapabacteria bacterium]
MARNYVAIPTPETQNPKFFSYGVGYLVQLGANSAIKCKQLRCYSDTRNPVPNPTPTESAI